MKVVNLLLYLNMKFSAVVQLSTAAFSSTFFLLKSSSRFFISEYKIIIIEFLIFKNFYQLLILVSELFAIINSKILNFS